MVLWVGFAFGLLAV